MRRKTNYTPIIVLVGFAILTLTAVGGAVTVAVIRTQADQKATASPTTLTPSAPKADQADRPDLLGATMSEVRKELGAPTDIFSHGLIDGPPVSHDTTWTYGKGKGHLVVYFENGRVVAALKPR